MSVNTLGGVPKDTHTPLKSFRVSQELWDAAQVAAAENRESVSDVIRRALEAYVKKSERKRAAT